MLKLYSKGCEYALRLLSQIPKDNLDEKFLATDLCKKAGVPVHSARKVLQLLTMKGFLEAAPGPGGGYKLKKSAEKINLLDILTSIDGKDLFEHCVMGLAQCTERNPCPVHNLWKPVKKDIKEELRKKTLLQFISGVK
jgi:Rrf2 family protein